MKHNKYILLAAVALMAGMAGCKKDFLEEKRDLTGVNEEVYKDSSLAQQYVDFVYGLFQPPGNSQSLSWNLATSSTAFAQTTEELPGETNWNKVWATVSYQNAHALPYFGAVLTTSIGNNTWTRIKQINLFLDNIDQYGLPQSTRNKFKGQMYFWRAYQYFDLVRLYGGVPLVLHSQNPITSGTSGDELKVPRSSTSATIDQIISDLDSAVFMLPGKWTSSGSSGDWGRITKGGAAAFKGRVLLTYASPLFNRGDDRARWQRAYDANVAARTILESNGFGLFKTGTLSDGTAFENMFTTEVNNPEAVITFGFNNTTSDQTLKWNGWEQAARPRVISGAGSLNPTKQMMDAFPMKDGKMPGQSIYPYDSNKFYKNRDPRWYKTFAYNGGLWPYAQNTRFRLWTYRWWARATDTVPTSSNPLALPNSTTELTPGTTSAVPNNSGIYLRKATNPGASNLNTASTGGVNFSQSGLDYMEMRFAEVLLNLAESAIGVDKVSEGIDLIKLVRERGGVENKDGAFGLSGVSSRDDAFAAVLNERKIELAYEGKRFFDLRRWMLFNDDFGTCTRLKMKPLDGTRRTGIYIYVKRSNGAKYIGSNAQDPLFKPQNTGNIIADREPSAFPTGISSQDAYVDSLYSHVFVVKEKDDVDPTTAGWRFKWYSQYYFFGLSQGIINNSPYLEQTMNWDGLRGAGTFDPLK